VTPFCILFFGAFGGVHNPSADHHETNVAAWRDGDVKIFSYISPSPGPLTVFNRDRFNQLCVYIRGEINYKHTDARRRREKKKKNESRSVWGFEWEWLVICRII
jgi:hypothetical protein